MKAQKLKQQIEEGNWKGAFATARSFFFGIPAAAKRDIEIAADCLNGKESFYKSLGINTTEAIEQAKSFLTAKYCQ